MTIFEISITLAIVIEIDKEPRNRDQENKKLLKLLGNAAASLATVEKEF